jgi:hypothetical protein
MVAPERQPLDTDRNLLFGILAVQMNFISRNALIEAMNTWVLGKHKALGKVVAEHGQLSPERLQLLDALVNEHVKAHGDVKAVAWMEKGKRHDEELKRFRAEASELLGVETKD